MIGLASDSDLSRPFRTPYYQPNYPSSYLFPIAESLFISSRFTNWHYDLDINLPGLEVIHEMLKKMEDLRQRNRELMNKLSAIGNKYEDG